MGGGWGPESTFTLPWQWEKTTFNWNRVYMKKNSKVTNFVDDWYIALDVIFQDIKERLCYPISILSMTKNVRVMALVKHFGLFNQVSV